MASGMKKIVLDDFSGGISQSGAFSALTQLAKADGFVRNDAKRVRSQWPINAVVDTEAPNGASPLLVFPFGYGHAFFYANGLVNANEDGGTSGPYGTLAGGFKNVEHIYGGLFRYIKTGSSDWNMGIIRLPLGQPGPDGIPLRNAGEVDFDLTEIPTNVGDEAVLPDSGIVPRAAAAGMWKEYMIYANTVWNEYSPKDLTLHFDYQHLMWFMDPLNSSRPISRFPVAGAAPGESITAIQEVEEGLLVFTKPASSYYGLHPQSNLYLLRSNPADWVTETESGSKEIIAKNMSVSARPHAWDYQQSVVFVAETGRLYQYKNMRLADITPPFLVESEFIAEPANPDTRNCAVVTYGPNLFYWHGPTSSLFVMHVSEQTGTWSRVVGLEGSRHALLLSTQNGVFVGVEQDVNEDVRPYAQCFEIDLSTKTGTTHRGDVSGTPLDLVFATAPVGFDTPHAEKWWHQIGIRAKCAPGNPDGAKVKAVTTRGVLADGTVADHRVELPAQVASLSASGLLEYLVPAYGYGPTCQVELECEGDIIIEAITIWWQSGTERW
jgi:hypothetical protein